MTTPTEPVLSHRPSESADRAGSSLLASDAPRSAVRFVRFCRRTAGRTRASSSHGESLSEDAEDEFEAVAGTCGTVSVLGSLLERRGHRESLGCILRTLSLGLRVLTNSYFIEIEHRLVSKMLVCP